MPEADNPEEWQAWVDQACAAVGVDADLVDLAAVLALTRTVAQRYVRPMAPVAAHILGLAIASRGDTDPQLLIEEVLNTLPSPETD